MKYILFEKKDGANIYCYQCIWPIKKQNQQITAPINIVINLAMITHYSTRQKPLYLR
ncbi:MAG: hypothetical protein ABIN89_20570 [Chitinophagaceae bacterium]